jgi:N-acetylneuraminate synthase
MSITDLTPSVFHELFILELANNHLGDVERGLKIIRQHAQVVRFNNVRATIKLQFRDVDNFIHKDFLARHDIRYIKKTIKSRLAREDYEVLVAAIKEAGCMTSATPFDEASVELCEQLDLDFIKIASSDLNDWFLIERIARTGKPVVFSVGGSSLKDIDDLVKFFTRRNVPFAINHCVSIYPSEDFELELNQIDFLRNRYPGVVIGFSSHEYTSWDASMLIAYAKGARMFERHIDIVGDGVEISPYCSQPHQIDTWFRTFNKAKEMCGVPGFERRRVPRKEIEYLDQLVRGVYAKRDLPKGHVLHHSGMGDDFYLAIPLQKGQLSCREIMNGQVLKEDLKADAPLQIDAIDGEYAENPVVRNFIGRRGL